MGSGNSRKNGLGFGIQLLMGSGIHQNLGWDVGQQCEKKVGCSIFIKKGAGMQDDQDTPFQTLTQGNIIISYLSKLIKFGADQ